MAVTFNQFFGAIAEQESGGNYTAVNRSSGALGKYQVMPANVPYWSQKYLGVKWTPQQYLGDPNKQEALAKAVLSDYFNRYGVRGAASAWYSGQPGLNMNYRSQNGGPSIGSYVDSVIAKAMRLPSGGGSLNSGPNQNPQTLIVKDARVKTEETPPVGNTSGMGAVSAPGVTEPVTPGVDPLVPVGAQAVGEEQIAAPPTDFPAPAKPKEPTELRFGKGTPSGARELAVQAAMKWLGTPYVFGGGNANGPTKSSLAHGNFNDVGFDCSGLVLYALAAAGIHAPRLSWDQLKLGAKTNINQLQPGDLIGMSNGGHIGIYAGNGKMIEAPRTGLSVRFVDVRPGAWGVSLDSLYR